MAASKTRAAFFSDLAEHTAAIEAEVGGSCRSWRRSATYDCVSDHHHSFCAACTCL